MASAARVVEGQNIREITKKQVNLKPVQPSQKTKVDSRVKTPHILLITGLLVLVGTQLVMSKTSLNDLHYEIERLQVQTNQLKGENDAHYQHLSELSQMNRLKEIVNIEGLTLDNSRVYKLGQE